jgi:hypothetical protein
LPGAQAKADDELIGADSLYSKTVVATFPSSIHALLKHSDDFETAILAIMRAGGTAPDEPQWPAPDWERISGRLPSRKRGEQD